MVLRYTQVLISQMAQTAICNRHHTVEKQLCRWLLSCLDRIDGSELRVTQESIANNLGVTPGSHRKPQEACRTPPAFPISEETSALSTGRNWSGVAANVTG
jgi:hypothetical protein